jgi:15-cis-phytoene synthase
MAEPLTGEIRAMAKGHAPDFYLSALLAPRELQHHLVALAAFLGDVERIITTVSEPGIGEIRLQWWRDTILAAERGESSGHPIADALGKAIRAKALPFHEFDGLLDARALDLYADPIPDEAAFTAYLSKSDGAAFRLAARCLGADPDAPIVADAAQGYGIVRLMRTLPMFLARGRAPFPAVGVAAGGDMGAQLTDRRHQARERVALVRIAWGTAARDTRLACLPIAVVEPYLRAGERAGHDPALMLTDIQPLERIWRLWQAHALGRF